MTQAPEWKSCLICYISFVCEKIYKVWFKNLWNWLCNSDLMIFDLLAPPQRPCGGGGPKNGAVACAIHVSNSHTKSGWISEKKILTTQPPTVLPSPTPGAWPRRPNENPVWYVLYLSFVRRHIKFGLEIFEIDLVIEIKWYYLIFDLLAPPQGPRGRGQKMCRCTPHSCEQHTHQICLDFVQWFRRRYWANGWTEAVAISPTLF